MNTLQNIKFSGFQRPVNEIFISVALYQISFLLVFLLNALFAELNSNVLIYLPAGIVFICLLVFRWTAAVGLISSLIIKYSLLDNQLDLSFIAAFSIATIFIQLLFLNLLTKILKLDKRLNGLTQFQIIFLVVAFSILHAASHFYILQKASPFNTYSYVDLLMGTFFGIVVCLFFLRLFMIATKKKFT